MNWRKLLAAGIMVALQQQLTPTLQFYSSNPSRSLYTDVAGHGLANFRVGFRSRGSWDVYTWVKNAFDKDYFESLTAATGGNTGLVVGQPADSRTWGLTVRAEYLCAWASWLWRWPRRDLPRWLRKLQR